jgi:hypothetical protein
MTVEYDPFEKVDPGDPKIKFGCIRGWDTPEEYVSWLKEHMKEFPEVKDLGYCNDPDELQDWFNSLSGNGTVKLGALCERAGKGETVVMLHPETFDAIEYEVLEGSVKRKGIILEYKNGKPYQWAITPTVYGWEAKGKRITP